MAPAVVGSAVEPRGQKRLADAAELEGEQPLTKKFGGLQIGVIFF
jgi:hypothetical protein